MTKPGPLCHKCPLKDAPGPVWGEGPSNAKLVVVGQCPGPDEISQGRPFVGGSGGILERSLARVGWDRSRTFITNTVKCFVPPKTPVPAGAVACCASLIRKELDTLEQYTTILTLGQEAFNAFTGKKMLTVSPPRSTKKPPNPDHWLRGCVYHLGQSRSIVPAAHPAYVASTGFRDATWFDCDVAKAVRWAKGLGIRYEEHYDYNPSEAQIKEGIQQILQQGDFALDFETPEKSQIEEEEELLGSGPTEIQVAGISAAPGECLGVPGDMLPLLRNLFTAPHEKPCYCRVFNWGFEGYHLQRTFGHLTVVPIDLMLQLNRCYSDAKRKDLGTALSLFTDMDYTKNLSKTNPNRYNACDTYGTLVGSRNAQSFMEDMGIWQAYLEADVPLWDAVIEMKVIGTNCDVEGAQRMELQMYKALNAYEKWWSSNIPLVEWQSPQQLIAMFKSMGLPIIMRQRRDKNKNKYQSPTCDDEALEIYINKHHNKVAGLIQTMRSLKKASDFTHLYSSDGRAHPSHKIHGQVAGRVQAKDPDLQNVPEELAGIYPRSIIIPDDPNTDCIISADFEAIEFYIYGYAASCKAILECKKEGKYIYGMFYEDIFHKPFFEPGKPPKKPYRLKTIPPWELLVAKSGPLGMLYGRGPKSLEDGFGISKSESYKIYDGFFNRYWEVARYHETLRNEVTRNGYLRNFFNRIRWFPNPRGMFPDIAAFPGQSNAADILIRNAINSTVGIKDFGGRRLFPVHDSIQFTCPRRALYGAVSFIRDAMEAPVAEMNNFYFPCTIKVGTLETSKTGKPNWNDQLTWEDWVLEYGYAKHKRAVGDVQGIPEGQVVEP
jgi:uracil-DNA glycosylase family 4